MNGDDVGGTNWIAIEARKIYSIQGKYLNISLWCFRQIKCDEVWGSNHNLYAELYVQKERYLLRHASS